MEMFLLHIIFTLLILAYGMRIGWKAREDRAKKYLSYIEEELNKQDEENCIYVDLVVHDNCILCYEKETSKFLVQAYNKDELYQKLKDMFPNKRFLTSKETLSAIGIES